MAKINVKKSAAAQAAAEASETAPPQIVKSATGETPTAEVIRDANGTATITDERGRVLTVKKLSTLKKLKLQELIGASAAGIQSYMGTAVAACSVIKIDGQDVPWPVTKLQFEGLVDRLDEEGIGASTIALADLMGVEVDEEGNLTMGGRIISAAKK